MLICPKCGFVQEDSLECAKCGIVIKKYMEGMKKNPPGDYTQKENNLSFYASKKTNVVKIVLLIGVALLAVAFFQKDKLPDQEGILEEIYQAPVQRKTGMAPFEIEAGEITYTITPLYEYELYGMVVSYHHSGSWWDIYHHKIWNDFINIKDICVIWGENIETGVYKDMKFSSGTWTCNYRWPNQEVGSKFRNTCLSNNHLLSEDKGLKKEIMSAKRGDQIYLRGYLARYSHSGDSFHRGTSTTRTDTGNGACETIYLKDFQVLKKANTLWRFIFLFTKYLIFVCIILWLILFIKEPVKMK